MVEVVDDGDARLHRVQIPHDIKLNGYLRHSHCRLLHTGRHDVIGRSNDVHTK